MTQMVATLREAPTKSALGHPRRPGVVRHISAFCPNTDDCSLLMFCGSAGISLTKLEQCEPGRSGFQLATLSARFHEGFQRRNGGRAQVAIQTLRLKGLSFVPERFSNGHKNQPVGNLARPKGFEPLTPRMPDRRRGFQSPQPAARDGSRSRRARPPGS
jgi:hypothetical protein